MDPHANDNDDDDDDDADTTLWAERMTPPGQKYFPVDFHINTSIKV